MIINSSAVTSSSSRQYQVQSTYESTRVNKPMGSVSGNSFSDLFQKGSSFNTLNYQVSTNSINKTAPATVEKKSDDTFIKFRTLAYILQLMFLKQNGLNPSVDSSRIEDSDLAEELASMLGYSLVGGTTEVTEKFTYSESETTSFSTSGCVCTSDGRTIDFDISVTMSRSFYQEYTSCYEVPSYNLCDPLVINFDTDATELSDQKFYFDLNCDGKEESISYLGSGSGFLALDKNNDGIINDGSELFGTKTRNGFAELLKYDLDNNGWIDEADEIFDMLKIWTFDEDGNGRLISLKDANVGAINLQSVSTNFSLNQDDNTTNGVVRRSGIFLFENGNVGSMQQLDLAT